LNSVFGQTFRDFEVIVINDGSPDAAQLEVALQPYRTRIRYIQQENRGLAGARNAGVRLARGELLAFVDSDDIWMPDYLSAQVEFLTTILAFVRRSRTRCFSVRVRRWYGGC